MRNRAFTLIEMLVASAMVSLLLGGVMTMVSGMNRDVQRVEQHSADSLTTLMSLLTHDLANATAFNSSADGRALELSGQVGVDQRSLSAAGRLARVIYRINHDAQLYRQQNYTDATDRPQPWRELVASDVESIRVTSLRSDSTYLRISLKGNFGTITRELKVR